MNLRKYIRPHAVQAMLAALLVGSLLLGLAEFRRADALQHELDAVRQKAFTETVALLDSMGGQLEKIAVSGCGAKEQELLGSVARQADAAQDNLAALPASQASVSGSLRFVNQAGDFARVLAARLAAGGSLDETDLKTVVTLSETCRLLSAELTDAAGGTALSMPVGGAATGEVEPQIQYPVLLYDGPFSDGRSDGTLRLSGDEYTAGMALDKARAWIGPERISDLRLTGEGSVPVPCYELLAETESGTLSLAVSRQGGEIVYMLSDRAPGEARFSQAELIDLASAFLKSRGYPPMSVSYWSFYDGLLTVNFAALQDGVVLYPDLIKVQMNAATGLVCGIEAVNWLSNRRVRENLTPSISAEEAASRLSPLLRVENTRLCVIPTDAGEALCHEFRCSFGETSYLVYVDAHSGLEREIYRLLEDAAGQLAV